jgi:methylated-DNA-[protein]-cysteine S-methyltransferase
MTQTSTLLTQALAAPPPAAQMHSRRRIQTWFIHTAPLLHWASLPSPLGPIYLAASAQGVCRLQFGLSQTEFLNLLDPLARTEWNPPALLPITAQLTAYFAGQRIRLDCPLDFTHVTPFQQRVLHITRTIPPGLTWTYKQIAYRLNQPQATRAVGQALGHNPLPIIIPCHRVIASSGQLGGYSGGGGLASKKLLLQLEGALLP